MQSDHTQLFVIQQMAAGPIDKMGMQVNIFLLSSQKHVVGTH